MRTGEPVSAAPGATRDKVLSLHALACMGSLRADVEPHPNYRARNYGMFLNGLWRVNGYVGSDTNSVRIGYPLEPGSYDTSIAVIDVGDHEAFDENYYVPGGWIREEETSDSARIRFSWTAGWLVDEANGEGSLSSVVLTGVKRFGNVEPDPKFSTRARLWYTIETPSGSDHIVRLWANGTVVCSAQRTGDGLLTFTENNSSGLTGQGLLTYTADVLPEEWFILLRWPASYNVHYSTSALAYPRTPELVVYDTGLSNYVALSPILAAGSYNYSVQAVGDDATLQSPVPAPSDSPKVVKRPPNPVTWVGATGNYSAITVSWLGSDPYCSYTVYSSLVDEPVNYGQWPDPLPINRPVGSTSCVLWPIASWQPLDRTSAWTTFQTQIDDVVANMNAAYDAGYSLFLATLATQEALAKEALTTLATATGIPTPEHLEVLGRLFDQESEQATLGSGMSVSDFGLWMYATHSAFLQGMSSLVEGTTGRYSFSDGTQPFSAPGDPIADGDAGVNQSGMSLRTSVYDLVHPLVTNRKVRVVIRATRLSDGLQECNDEVHEIELDGAGDVVLPRPNAAFVSTFTPNNLTVGFKLQTKTDDQEVAANKLAIYYAAAPTPITYSVPAGQVTPSDEVTGLRVGTVSITFPSPGYYTIGSKSISAAGTLSTAVMEQTIWVGTEQPAAALGVSALVIRSQPVAALQDGPTI